MSDIPPLVIAPDEAEREMVRELLVEYEVAGTPAKALPIVKEALYDAWGEIDRLRAAQGAGEAKEEEPCTR